MAPGVLTAMRYAMLGPAGKVFSFELPEKSLRELEGLSQRFTLLHLDRSFKGLEFFNSCLLYTSCQQGVGGPQ